MQFRKIYLEISNICNLNCTFCPGTTRKKHSMDLETLRLILPKIRPYTDFLYFHLMGEPLLHPRLADFLDAANEYGFRVILTTNGVLLPKVIDTLLASPALHKVNISLHAHEANDRIPNLDAYLDGCFSLGERSLGKFLVVYRLWNEGGLDAQNQIILQKMEKHFPKPWRESPKGTGIGKRVFLEYGEKFDWPDLAAPDYSGRFFCHGLRDQIGILCDGTVVPCCLDHDGDIALGNILQTDLDSILSSPRAQKIYNGFSEGNASEALCRRCGYARRFV